MNVKEKLLQVQQKLNAPKKQFNKFGGYNYRNCEDILEAVKPLLEEVKAVVVVTDLIEVIGQRTYVKATARFIDCESEEEQQNTAYAREEETKKGMDASQLTGATSSYARKYALNGLFLIDDVKDADNMDNSQDKNKAQSGNQSKAGDTKPPTQGRQTAPVADNKNEIPGNKIDAIKIATLNGELQRTGVGAKSMCAFFKVSSIEDFTILQFAEAMDKLKGMPDKKVGA